MFQSATRHVNYSYSHKASKRGKPLGFPFQSAAHHVNCFAWMLKQFIGFVFLCQSFLAKNFFGKVAGLEVGKNLLCGN